MEITGKRTLYTFKHENEEYSVNGSFEVSDDCINNFNGNVEKDGESCGFVSYSETSDGKINKNFNNIDKDVDLCSLLNEMISAVKESI